jgi:nitrite reductase (NO-forming)
VRAELATWNAGAAAIGAGVPLDLVWLTGLGGTLVLAGAALYAGGLVALRKRSIQRRPWATRWYLTATACLAAGALLGPVLASDAAWTRGSLLGAHLALNLGGWFGLTIAGTLHTFYPSLTGTRLRWAGLEQPCYLAWTLGVLALAAGAAWNSDPLGVAGWAALTVAGGLVAANLLASARAATQRPPAMLVVSLAQVLLVVTLAAGLASAVSDGPLAGLVGADRDALALLLVGGWVGLTVAGSLLHLLWLMGRVRRPGRSPRGLPRERVAVAGAAIAALGLLLTAAGAPAGPLIAVGYVLLAARIVPLAVRAVRAAPLRL